jgi:drug/metabolite transporter (DMT)-like permease
MNRQWKEWGAFALLGLIWGSSFLWIKLAVQEISPFMLVALRLLFGLAGVLVVMRLQKQAFPRERRLWMLFAIMGVLNTAIPFTLISWGEKHIPSGLASILNGTVPLFTIIIAHCTLPDEKITLARFGGLSVGFVGMVVLVSGDLEPRALLDNNNLWGQLAVVAAALCYALALAFSRKYLRGQKPVVQSALTLLSADIMMWIALPIAESPVKFPTLPLTWFAIAWLGLLGLCVAYLMLFSLMNAWGPTRTSLVTYVFPVIGVLLGVVFLDETADWRLWVGTLLITGGIIAANFRALWPKQV